MKPEFINLGVAILPTNSIRSIVKYNEETTSRIGGWFSSVVTKTVTYGLWIEDFGEEDVPYKESDPWDLIYQTEEERDRYYKQAVIILTGIDNESTNTI